LTLAAVRPIPTRARYSHMILRNKKITAAWRIKIQIPYEISVTKWPISGPTWSQIFPAFIKCQW
jgi:hypothetical protein